jgi:hypothetical protein
MDLRRDGHTGQLLLCPSEQAVEARPVLSLDPLLQLRIDIHGHGRVRIADLIHDHPPTSSGLLGKGDLGAAATMPPK